MTNITEINIAADEFDRAESSERTDAEIAADFANALLMHRHRGVINCDSYYVLFGNDGYAEDKRSRNECDEIMNHFLGHDMQQGVSSNGITWAIVLTDHSRSLYDEEELQRLVWDTWMEVCDQLAK